MQESTFLGFWNFCAHFFWGGGQVYIRKLKRTRES